MSKTVTFIQDVYPYCVGDVIVLNDDELKAVDAVAKARKAKVYEAGAKAEVESSAEFDRQEANRAAVDAGTKEAQASVDLQVAEAEQAADENRPSTSGRVAPGTAAGTELKTAAAKGKGSKQ